MLAAAGAGVLALVVLYAGMKFRNACDSALLASHHINRLQVEATFHLANYVHSGDVRDLQRFRSLSSPLLELSEHSQFYDFDTDPSEQLNQTLFRAGLSEKQVKDLNELQRAPFLRFSIYRGVDSWDYAIRDQYRLLHHSRIILRDHVKGSMTPERRLSHSRTLQAMQEMMSGNRARFESDIMQTRQRTFRLSIILSMAILLTGFLGTGYFGYYTEYNLKKHDRALLNARKRYQDMFVNAGIGVVQVSPDGKLLWGNEQMAKILGYETVDELYANRGNFDRIFLEPERKSDFRTTIQDNGFVSNFMFRALRKDERKIWLMANAQLVRDAKGRVICHEGTYQDYTVYRQTNQELHHLTLLLRGMAQSIFRLLVVDKSEKAINQLLQIVGQSSGVDRVFIMSCDSDDIARYLDLQFEWVKYDSLSTIRDDLNKKVPLHKINPELNEKLEKGKVVQLVTRDTEGPWQQLMKKQKTRVRMVAPIVKDGRFWGIIGLDNCSEHEKWPDDVTQILKTVASAIGHYLVRVDIEKSLRQSKNQYQKLVSSIREIVFQISSDGKLVFLNQAWENITGNPIEESIGTSLYDYIHRDDRGKVRQAVGEMVKKRQESIRLEYRLVTKKGAIRWLESNGMLMHDPENKSESAKNNDPARISEEMQIYGTMYDLTQRKKAEMVMKRNNQRLEALIESSPVIITATDPNGRLTLWNRSAERNLGWRREETMGKPAPHVPEKYLEEHYDLLDQVLSGERIQELELERVRKNGKKIYLSISAEPLFDESRKVEQVMMFAQNITEARLSREAIKKSLKEKEVLLSEIHHRVKNNMAVISGLLSLKAQQQTDPGVASILRQSEGRIHSMSMIHEKLYQTDTYAEVEFGSYLMDLASHLESQYVDYNTRINTQVKAEKIQLEISQAVPCGLLANELLTNSYLHAFKDRAEGEIMISMRKRQGYCELIFRDDGPGFPEDILSGKNGNSLGMHLIRAMSKQMKGEMSIGNKQGAWFRLVFKLVDRSGPRKP